LPCGRRSAPRRIIAPAGRWKPATSSWWMPLIMPCGERPGSENWKFQFFVPGSGPVTVQVRENPDTGVRTFLKPDGENVAAQRTNRNH
jgi:hypothetical protein